MKFERGGVSSLLGSIDPVAHANQALAARALWRDHRGVVRLKLVGLSRAELLKCSREQIRTKSAKVGDGRPARSRAPGGPSTKRSSLLRPGKAAKAGAQRLHKKVLAPGAGPKLLKWPLPAAPQTGHGFTGGAKLLKREAPQGAEQNC